MVLPYQQLYDVIHGKRPMIYTNDPFKTAGIHEEQIQPASLDLTLKGPVYVMKASALPQNNESVISLAEKYAWIKFDLSDQDKGLERGVTHLIPLNESLDLSGQHTAFFSPKSSTGRNDVFVRVLGDRWPHYDRLPPSYKGPLYLEVTPLSFRVNVRKGLSLAQMRIRKDNSHYLSDDEIAFFHSKSAILFSKEGRAVSNRKLNTRNSSLYFHVDLDREVVGFEAKEGVIEELAFSKKEAHDPYDFWNPIRRPKNRELILIPNKFYLLATKERVRIPPEVCGEIMPYEITSGEIRPHYAGFFDNGFGGDTGTTGVLEVRAREIPFRITDSQPICRMVFERTTEIPRKLYAGNYRGGHASLSKHFIDRVEVWGE